VMWSSQDTPVHGRVAGIHEQFSPAGADVTITGDEGEAVYSIHEWDDSLADPAFQDAPSQPNVAKPESSLDESSLEMPPATEEHFASKTMTDTDEPDDATKWRILKRVFFGSDDGDVPEAPDQKASDGDDEDDEDEDDEDDMEQSKQMTDGTNESDVHERVDELTETVEQISEKLEDGGDDGESEPTIEDKIDALAEKVGDLDERVDTISKQSGHSQQLNGTEKSGSEPDDDVEAFKAGLVGRTGGD